MTLVRSDEVTAANYLLGTGQASDVVCFRPAVVENRLVNERETPSTGSGVSSACAIREGVTEAEKEPRYASIIDAARPERNSGERVLHYPSIRWCPMSHQMLERVLEHSAARGPAKAVLMVLAHQDFGNEGWKTDLGVLVWKSGFGLSTVKRALDTLVQLGEIRRDGTGHGVRTHFTILLECPAGCAKPGKHAVEMARSGLAAGEDGPERAISKPRAGHIKGSERTSSSKKRKRSSVAPLRAGPTPPGTHLPSNLSEVTRARIGKVVNDETLIDDLATEYRVAAALAVTTERQAEKLLTAWWESGRPELARMATDPDRDRQIASSYF